jgi:hypothetical protein
MAPRTKLTQDDYEVLDELLDDVGPFQLLVALSKLCANEAKEAYADDYPDIAESWERWGATIKAAAFKGSRGDED